MSDAVQAPVHVCLISDNLLPNLIPILMDKPACVYLVVSADMQPKSQRFKVLLTDRQIATQIYPDAPSTGLAGLLEYARRVGKEIQTTAGKRPIVLNATGGTKLMALAFVEVFRQLPDSDIIYTDTEHNCLESLINDRQPTRPMRGVLDVTTYLAAQGLRYTGSTSADTVWCNRAQQRQALTAWLAEQAGALDGFFGNLNRLVDNALDQRGETLVQATQLFSSEPKGIWRQAMIQIQQHGLLTWQGSSEFTFRDAEAARYLRGLWLEEYAWHVVSAAQPDDVHVNVTGNWESNPTRPARNEFDLLAVHRNRMLVVECKTLRFGAETRDQDILFKLESLGRNAGGLFGRTLLLSARPLTNAARDRANSQRIQTIEAAGLGRLSKHIKDWMSD
jgi:hypothetical protein